MGKAGLRIHGCIGWCVSAALLAGCGSGDAAPAPSPDANLPGDAAAAVEPDAPAGTPDLPTAPGPDAPFSPVDGPLLPGDAVGDGGPRVRVDYCLPILPLPTDGRDCPTTLDGARVLVTAALDGGTLDAAPWDIGRATIEACVEPVVMFLPRGRGLGWGVACYYGADSGQLLSIAKGTDTPTECLRSSVPNTAAFTYEVYGQYVKCSWPGPG